MIEKLLSITYLLFHSCKNLDSFLLDELLYIFEVSNGLQILDFIQFEGNKECFNLASRLLDDFF